MNKNIRAVMIVTAIAFTCGVNVYKAKNIDEFEDKIKKIMNDEL